MSRDRVKELQNNTVYADIQNIRNRLILNDLKIVDMICKDPSEP